MSTQRFIGFVLDVENGLRSKEKVLLDDVKVVEVKKMDREFMECRECSEKPGSPVLCSSCLNNRDAIHSLAREKQILEKQVKALEKEIKENIPDYRPTGEGYWWWKSKKGATYVLSLLPNVTTVLGVPMEHTISMVENSPDFDKWLGEAVPPKDEDEK